MKLEDSCPVCIEPAPSKEYQTLPDSLCPVCVEPEPEIPKPTVIKMTEYCLRAYMRSAARSKYCAVPPRGCS